MFDEPDEGVVKVTILGPWAVTFAVSEGARALLADEIKRIVPVIMRGVGNHDGYNEHYRVTVEAVSQ